MTGYQVNVVKKKINRVPGKNPTYTLLPAGNKVQTVGPTVRKITITGLDATSGIVYSVSVRSNTSLGFSLSTQTPPVTANFSAKATVVVLTSRETSIMVAPTKTTLTFRASATAPLSPLLTGLRPGSVVVAGISAASPQGMLKKVLSVTKPSPKVLTLTVANAKLNEAFNQVGFTSTANPVQKSSTFTAATAGIRASVQPAGIGFEQNLTLGGTLDDSTSGFLLESTTTLTASVSVDASVDWSSAEIAAEGKISATTSGKVGARLAVADEMKPKKLDKFLGEFSAPPIPLPTPVPLFVVPKVEVYMTLTGKVRVESYMQFSISAQARARALWSSSNNAGLQIDKEASLSKGTLEPHIGANAEFAGGVSVRLDMLFEGVAGPQIQINAEVVVTFSPTETSWLKVGGRVEIHLVFDVDLWFWTKNFGDITVMSKEFGPWLTLDKDPPVKSEIFPSNVGMLQGTTKQFSQTQSPASPKLSWRLSGDAIGDSVTQDGLVKVGSAPTGRKLAVQTVDDKDLVVGQTLIYVVLPEPTPTPKATRITDGTALDVSWPATSGPDTVYTVSTVPATSTAKVTATSAALTGLRRDMAYTVYVVAQRADTITSAPGTTTVGLWVQPPTDTTLVGTDVKVGPAAPGRVQFNLTAGQHVHVTLTNRTMSTGEYTYQEVAKVTMWPAGSPWDTNQCEGTLKLTHQPMVCDFFAKTTGTYIYQVGLYSGADAGTVNVVVQTSLPTGPTVTDTIGALPTSVNLSGAHPAALGTFYASEGQEVWLVLSRTTLQGAAAIDVSFGGSYVSGTHWELLAVGKNVAVLHMRAPQAGVYSYTVWGVGGFNGAAKLTLQSTPSPVVS